jgi:hypothetical protein
MWVLVSAFSARITRQHMSHSGSWSAASLPPSSLNPETTEDKCEADNRAKFN